MAIDSGYRFPSASTGRLPCVSAALTAAFCASATAMAQVPPAQWRISGDPILTIGTGERPQDEIFTRIEGAFRLPDGRFVVADGAELRVFVFDATGRRTASFGGDGEGPGELRSLAAVWWAGGDTIGVWDSRLVRLTRFRADGTIVRTDNIDSGDPDSRTGRGLLDPFLGAFADGSISLAWLTSVTVTPGRVLQDQLTIGVFDRHGRLLRTLGRYAGMMRVLVPGLGSGPMAFSPYGWSAVVSDRLAFTNGVGGSVVLLDPDADSARASRMVVPGRDIALDDAWEQLDEVLEAPGSPTHMIRLAQRTDRSLGEVPRLARILADDAGNIWAKDYDPGKDALAVRRGRYVGGGTWRVVDPGGRQIASITMPDHVAPLAVHGDLVLTIARDALDVESFAVYRLQR